jgi:hypothetical protein
MVKNIAEAFAGPDFSALQQKRAEAQNRAADVFAGLYLPQLPTRHEIVERALAMFTDTPSRDVIVSRAYAMILDTIGARLRIMAAAHWQTAWTIDARLARCDDLTFAVDRQATPRLLQPFESQKSG